MVDVERIRGDFPSLHQQRNGLPPIYFDNACMTLRPRSVIEALQEYYSRFPACGGAGRSGHWFAKETNKRAEAARESIRRLINARSTDEIVFTRNTTESINLVARAFPFRIGDVVLTTDKEHNSNLVPWQWLAQRQGIVHKVVPVRSDNTFDVGALDEALRGPVRLASFGHVSNLDGVAIPAKQIIDMCHSRGAVAMLDAAQSVPHMKIDVQQLGVDLLAFSLHKMCGPSGMGVLYGRRELLDQMDTFIVGGDTIRDTYVDRPPLFLPPPHKYEAGLQDYAGMIASGAAVEYLESLSMAEIHAHELELNRFLTRELERFEEIEIVGPRDPALRGGILAFFVRKPGLGDLAEQLDQRANIAVRSGLFCVNSWFNCRGINRNLVATRVSLYLYNTIEECRAFVRTLEGILLDPIYEGLPLLPVREDV